MASLKLFFYAFVAFRDGFVGGSSVLHRKSPVVNIRQAVTAQTVNASFFNASGVISADPTLDGMVVDPIEDDDITTWFPTETLSTSNATGDEDGFATSKRGIIRSSVTPNAVSFTNG